MRGERIPDPVAGTPLGGVGVMTPRVLPRRGSLRRKNGNYAIFCHIPLIFFPEIVAPYFESL